jgi:hypothetical protein
VSAAGSLRFPFLVCAIGLLLCVLGILAALLFGGPAELLPWVGAGAVLFALLPKIIMTFHLALWSELSAAQKEEWTSVGWGLEPVIVAFLYLLREGAPLPAGSSARWRPRRRWRVK